MEYVAALIALVAVVVVLTKLVKRVVVFEHERAILYSGGKFRCILEPGVHWLRGSSNTVRKLDVRSRFASLSGQEILTADSVTLKISLAAKYAVVDPHVAISGSEDYQQALHLELQLTLREIVGSINVDDLLKQRAEISTRLMELAAPKARVLGLEMQSVGIKDVMFPGELKKIFAEVVRAQKEGAAALEKARGETAALRSLANAARMIEANPALLQLRLLQAIGERSGNTVVLGLPAQVTLVPIAKGTSEIAGQAQLPVEGENPNA